MRRALILVLFAALSRPVASQSVLTVDPGGGSGAFPTIQAAVDAASSGDIILIAEGEYGSVTVAKALTLAADRDATVRITGTLRVENTPAGSTTRILGLTGQPPLFGPGPALRLSNCQGPVWIEDCAFTGEEYPLGLFFQAALIQDCARVVVTRSRLAGFQSNSTAAAGGDGITVARSTLHVFESVIAGGDGLGNTRFVPSAGGAGLVATSSLVHLQDTAVTGGSGGGGTNPSGGCFDGAAGGHALVANAGSDVRHRKCTFVGGAGGITDPACNTGGSGSAQALLGGVVSELFPAVSHGLAAHNVTREGASLDYVVTGPAGDLVWLALALETGPIYLPFLRGPLLLDAATLVIVPLGALPASGTLTVNTLVPELGPGVASASLYLQVIAVAPNGVGFAGSGVAVTLLDGAF